MLNNENDKCEDPNFLEDFGDAVRRSGRKVAVAVPTSPPHFSYAMRLLESYRRTKPIDAELFFVFSTDKDEKLFASKSEIEFSEDANDGAVHSIVLQKKLPGWQASSKKWIGLWNILIQYDRFRYAVAMDDETVFTPFAAKHSFKAAIDGMMANKVFDCLMTREVDPYDWQITIMRESLDITGLNEGEAQRILQQVDDGRCYSWWVNAPVFDLSNYLEYLCRKGITLPPFRKGQVWEGSALNVFDHLEYQYFLVAQKGFKFQRVDGIPTIEEGIGGVRGDRRLEDPTWNPKHLTQQELYSTFCDSVKPLWSYWDVRCEGSFLYYHCDRYEHTENRHDGYDMKICV